MSAQVLGPMFNNSGLSESDKWLGPKAISTDTGQDQFAANAGTPLPSSGTK